MAKRKAKPRAVKPAAAPAPVHGATPQDVLVTLEGRDYHLLFDYGALEAAEMKLAAVGIHLSMLVMVDVRKLGAQRLPFFFFAALLARHPDMTWEQAKALLTFRSALPIHNAVCDAYIAAMVDPRAAKEKEPDPTPEPAAAL